MTQITTELAPVYIYGWTEKIKAQLYNFKQDRSTMTTDEQIEYIQRQYYLLQLLNKALDGKIQFVGTYHHQTKPNIPIL